MDALISRTQDALERLGDKKADAYMDVGNRVKQDARAEEERGMTH